MTGADGVALRSRMVIWDDYPGSSGRRRGIPPLGSDITTPGRSTIAGEPYARCQFFFWRSAGTGRTGERRRWCHYSPRVRQAAYPRQENPVMSVLPLPHCQLAVRCKHSSFVALLSDKRRDAVSRLATGEACVVLEVRTFSDVPVLCNREYSHQASTGRTEVVLRRGACYVRGRRRRKSRPLKTCASLSRLQANVAFARSSCRWYGPA